MDRKFYFLALAFIIFFLPVIHAQENTTTQIIVRPDLSAIDKAYLDGLNAKTIAQITSKLDTTQIKLEQTLKQSVDEARQQIKTEIVAEIKSNLKVIAIGLAGVILVAMSVMKVVEYALNHSKKIKKYELALEKQKGEYELLIKETKKLILENETAKTELNRYKQSLDAYAIAMGMRPPMDSELAKMKLSGKMFEPPQAKKKLPLFWKILFIIIGIIVAGFILLIILNFVRMR